MNGAEWFALVVVLLMGCFIVLVFMNFDKLHLRLFGASRDERYFMIDRLLFAIAEKDIPYAENILNALKNILDKISEHYSMLTQGSISVLIVICVTILIILGKVDAAAGLPIISGVAGYFIAKVPQKTEVNRDPSNRERQR